MIRISTLSMILKLHTLYINIFFLLFILFAYTTPSFGCDEKTLQENEKYTQLVRSFLGKGQVDSAIHYQLQAKQLLDQTLCNSLKAKASTNLLTLFFKKGDMANYQKEKQYALYLIDHIIPATDSSQGLLLQALGNNTLEEKDYNTAKIYLDKALVSFQNSKAWHSYVRTGIILSNMYQYLQDYNQMKKILDEAYGVLITKIPDNYTSLYNIQQNYGSYYYRIGDYHQSLDSMTASLLTQKNNLHTKSDTHKLISSYNNVGLLYIEVGDIQKAEEYSIIAFNMALQNKELQHAIHIIYNFAETSRVKGDYLKAYEYLTQAKTLYKETYDIELKSFKNIAPQSQNLLININNSLAQICPLINKEEEGYECLMLNQALHQWQPYRAYETYHILGDYAMKNNRTDLKSPLFYYEKALNITLDLFKEHHPETARMYQSIGKYYQKAKQYKKALDYFDKGLIALYNKNIKYNLALLPSPNAIKDRTLYAEILHDKAATVYRLKDNYNALKYISYSYELITQVRDEIRSEGSKLFIQNKLMPIYELYIRFCYELSEEFGQESEKAHIYIGKALDIIEKSKAILLLETLKASKAKSVGHIPEAILIEENRLKNKIAALEKSIFEAQNNAKNDSVIAYRETLVMLKDSLEKMQENIEANYSQYYNILKQKQSPSLSEIQLKIPANAQVLEYFFGNDHIYICNITKEQARIYRMVKNHHIDNKLNALQNTLTNSSLLLEDPQAAHRLFVNNAYFIYESFVKEVIDTNKKQLIIVPDGLLNYIPFEALITAAIAGDKAYDFKTLPYLLHDYDISYNYSIALMLYEKGEYKNTKRAYKILSFAPSYDYTMPLDSQSLQKAAHHIRKNLKELPGAKMEVAALEEKFRGKYLYDTLAQESIFKKALQEKQYSVLHLAMHGYIDNKRPEYSGLIFTHNAKDSIEDNILHAYELMLMKIPANLVVLSACETGYGRFERGESVASIGRAFMHAGTPSVIMTLWPINDHASAILMNYFYDKLAIGMAKDKAMAISKKTYIEHANHITAHPFFWASFIQLGSTAEVKISRKLAFSDYAFYTSIILLTGLGIYTLYRMPNKAVLKKKTKPVA